jgi:hypothetical protein
MKPARRADPLLQNRFAAIFPTTQNRGAPFILDVLGNPVSAVIDGARRPPCRVQQEVMPTLPPSFSFSFSFSFSLSGSFQERERERERFLTE